MPRRNRCARERRNNVEIGPFPFFPPAPPGYAEYVPRRPRRDRDEYRRDYRAADPMHPTQ